MRQNIKDLLVGRFNDYLGVPKDQEVREKMEDNRSKRGKSAQKREEPGAARKVCEFCGRNDKNFQEESKYDMHLWMECPMLVTCSECKQVVPISTYAEHLLEGCAKSQHQQCPRCKEPVHANEYNGHIKSMACVPAKSPAVAHRCPLCHEDIGPGEEGWKAHLLKEGCPNNERTL